jgi:hypothetical protein
MQFERAVNAMAISSLVTPNFALMNFFMAAHIALSSRGAVMELASKAFLNSAVSNPNLRSSGTIMPSFGVPVAKNCLGCLDFLQPPVGFEPTTR